MESFKRIMLPLDGSEEGRRAVPTLLSLARVYQAEVLVFGCVNLNELTTKEELTPDNLVRAWDQAKAGLQAHLDEVVAECRAQELEARTLVAMGPPVEAILDTVKREKPDLVIMASHGRSGLQRLMVGSVTEGVLRRVGCPVLVVPLRD